MLDKLAFLAMTKCFCGNFFFIKKQKQKQKKRIMNSKLNRCETDFFLEELCSKIRLKIEKSDEVSELVYKACGRKVRKACELYNFISSGLRREKRKPS